MVEATILHADLDAFYASVEQRDHRELRGRPVLVGAGVVLAASYEARRFGVHGPMSVGAALRLCPRAVVVGPRFDAYLEASRQVFDRFRDVTPLVEGISIDEAFLDVAGARTLFGPPPVIAERLRARVRREVGLPLSIGIATTKSLAKVASAAAKPDGLLHVEAGTELAFLHPLPVGRLWGVGPVTGARLAGRGIHTVGDLAELPEAVLVGLVGPAAGHHLHALAHNRDPRPVVSGRRRRSLGSQSAMGRGRRSDDELHGRLLAIVDRVGRRLRAAGWLGRTVVLRLRFDDLARTSRSHTLVEPTDDTATIARTAGTLLHAELPVIHERGLTLLGLTLTNLQRANHLQLALPFGADRRALDHALDGVRERFGRAAVVRATHLHHRHEPLGHELHER